MNFPHVTCHFPLIYTMRPVSDMKKVRCNTELVYVSVMRPYDTYINNEYRNGPDV